MVETSELLKQKVIVWVNITKALGIAGFKSIYPKILTSSRLRGIRVIMEISMVLSINLISVSLINPLWPAVWKQAKKSLMIVYDLHLLHFSDCYPYNYSTCIWIHR